MSGVETLYSKIEEGRKGKNLGLKTGLPHLDWYTGGFQKGVYKLVYGVSGSGKSSVVVYADIYRILKDYPDKNILYVYFSLEMNESVLLAKILSLYLFDTYGIELSFMDLMSIRTPMLDEDYEKVLEAKQWLDSISNKFIIFEKQLSADGFYASMKEILKQYGEFSKSDDGRRVTYIPKDSEQIINVVLDHAGLLLNSKGRDKKQEIDLCSQYCVWFRETCGVSFDFIMQENRNAGNIDRQKMNMSESTLDDVKDSGNPVNDANVIIAVYYPIKYQLKTYRDYRIVDNKDTGELGLGSAMRSLILLKHRFGNANKVFPVAFQGSVGRFEELPSPDQVDYNKYQSWKEDKMKEELNNEKDLNIKDESNKLTPDKVKFSF